MVARDGKGEVLVLEDSILVAMAIEAALEDRGFTTVTAGTIAAAEERIERRRPRIALLDLRLPDGTALDLATRLHAQGCKVALCTGVDAAGVPAGFEFAEQFRKPVSPETLANWVETVAGTAGA